MIQEYFLKHWSTFVPPKLPLHGILDSVRKKAVVVVFPWLLFIIFSPIIDATITL